MSDLVSRASSSMTASLSACPGERPRQVESGHPAATTSNRPKDCNSGLECTADFFVRSRVIRFIQ